jgi:hypothetical protein
MIVGTNIGISQEIGSLRYPTDMADNQDVIKFSLIKYKVNDITSQTDLDFWKGDRIK